MKILSIIAKLPLAESLLDLLVVACRYLFFKLKKRFYPPRRLFWQIDRLP